MGFEVLNEVLAPHSEFVPGADHIKKVSIVNIDMFARRALIGCKILNDQSERSKLGLHNLAREIDFLASGP